jgi:hypothetical protein
VAWSRFVMEERSGLQALAKNRFPEEALEDELFEAALTLAVDIANRHTVVRRAPMRTPPAHDRTP